MSEILPITWYMESPIDFEHKQYVLFSYLQKVDNSFLNRKLSPHLLHIQKLLEELENFEVSFISHKKGFDKNRYIYFSDNSKLEGENFDLVIEIKEIVDFSIPQVKSRIDFGYKILDRHRQVLY